MLHEVRLYLTAQVLVLNSFIVT